MRILTKKTHITLKGSRRRREERALWHLARTQAQAIKAARAQVRAAGSGEVVIYSTGGAIVQTIVVQERRPSPRYRMEIEWSAEDDAYVVTVPDLPGCMTHGATYAEAAAKGENAIASWIAAARHWGTPIPTPRETMVA